MPGGCDPDAKAGELDKKPTFKLTGFSDLLQAEGFDCLLSGIRTGAFGKRMGCNTDGAYTVRAKFTSLEFALGQFRLALSDRLVERKPRASGIEPGVWNSSEAANKTYR